MAKDAAPKTVSLVTKEGDEVKISDLVSLNSLLYGAGYGFKDKGMTYEKAVDTLNGQGEELVLLNASAPTATAVVTPPAGGSASK